MHHDRALCLFKGTCGRGIYDNMKTAVETVFISVNCSQAGLAALPSSSSSSAAVHRPSFGRGWTARSYSNDVFPGHRLARIIAAALHYKCHHAILTCGSCSHLMLRSPDG
jgi:hypothetical protein